MLQLPFFLFPGSPFGLQFLLFGPRVMHLLLIINLQIDIEDSIEVFFIESRPLGLIGLPGSLPVIRLYLLPFPVKLHTSANDGLGIFLPD